MEPARSLREKLETGRVVVGILVTNHLWTELVEISIDAGLDYLIVDLEHGPHGVETVAEVCRLARISGFAALIRTPANDFRSVGYAMDLGPCGLVLAAVETGHELDAVRDAIYMPPRGRRRPGGMGNRWVDNCHLQTWQTQVEDDVIVIPQIETRTGLDHADTIATHEIVTAVGIGPYDLSMAVGANMDKEHPEMVEAMETVRRAAETAGKPMWRIGNPTALARAGFHFLCTPDVTHMLTEVIRQHVVAARES